MKIRQLPAFVFLSLAACSPNHSSSPGSGGATGADDSVVRARAFFSVTATGGGINPGSVQALSVQGTQPINVTLGAGSSMTLDNSLFVVPNLTNAVLDFGFLQISALSDNNLKVCGSDGKQKCTKAFIRMYTTGQAGSGLYNAADGFGAPISAGQSTLATVGLDIAGSASMQSIAIPSNKHAVKLSDFASPKYKVQADFTEAGAGTYSTTLVVEYALSL